MNKKLISTDQVENIIKPYIDGTVGRGLTIDSELSDTSENPVQNKVIKATLNEKANTTDIPTSLPANGGNADTLDGLHANEIASNANLLDNPNFKVNQRGASGVVSTVGYFVDRWQLVSGTAEITNYGIILNGEMKQILENAVGTNITASASSGTTSYDDSTKTFTLTATGETIAWVKLEFGSIATPFIPPNPATELVKCMRYYQIVNYDIPVSSYDNNVGCFFSGHCMIPMRTTPSVILPEFDETSPVVASCTTNQYISGWQKGKYTISYNNCSFQIHLINSDNSAYSRVAIYMGVKYPVAFSADL